jgi:DnaJ like chaperone protein
MIGLICKVMSEQLNMEILTRVYQILKANISFAYGDRDDTVNCFKQSNGGHEKQNKEISAYVNDDLAKNYANLEIPYGSDLQTAKKAWKKMLKKYHPDLHSRDPEKLETATRLTQGLTKAYNEIKEAHAANLTP